MSDATVYGEPAEAILATLSKSNQRSSDSGMHELDLRMPPNEARPLVRALMRAEAELLLKDADAFDPTREGRTPEQRRADALLEVVTAAAAALRV